MPVGCNFSVCVHCLISQQCNIFLFMHWLGHVCVWIQFCLGLCILNNAQILLCLIKYSFFTKMEHPEVRWSIVSSCFSHNHDLLSISSFKICTSCLVFSCHYCISVSLLMSPDFISHQYDCSISTRFSSKLCGSCPCMLFPSSISFVLSAMLSFICLVPLSTTVFRHLAVC